MTSDDAARRCQWCGTLAADGQTHCAVCGASLAQSVAIGDSVVPGVTHVDPNLHSAAAQPLAVPGANPGYSTAADVISALAVGVAPGLAGLGALAAVAAAEYLGAGRGRSMGPPSVDTLGQPNQALLDVVRRPDNGTATESIGVLPGANSAPAREGVASTPPKETFTEMVKRLDARFANDAGGPEPVG